MAYNNYIKVLLFIVLYFSIFANTYSMEADAVFKDMQAEPINWQNYETERNINNIKELAEKIPQQWCYWPKEGYEELLEYFHTVDLNGDGHDDVVYDGWCRPYPSVSIWLYQNGKYNKTYSSAGYIIKLNFHDNHTEFVIKKDGIACDRETFIEYFELDFQSDSIISTERLAYAADVIVPDLAFSKPFKITSPKGLLRIGPSIDNSLRGWECNEELSVKGNVIAEYQQNTKGIALAKSKNKKGWYFVLIYADSDSIANDNDIFYPIVSHTLSFGWMNSDHLYFQTND